MASEKKSYKYLLFYAYDRYSRPQSVTNADPKGMVGREPLDIQLINTKIKAMGFRKEESHMFPIESLLNLLTPHGEGHF